MHRHRWYLTFSRILRYNFLPCDKKAREMRKTPVNTDRLVLQLSPITLASNILLFERVDRDVGRISWRSSFTFNVIGALPWLWYIKHCRKIVIYLLNFKNRLLIIVWTSILLFELQKCKCTSIDVVTLRFKTEASHESAKNNLIYKWCLNN